MREIAISDEQEALAIDRAQLRRTVEHVLSRMEVREGIISLAIVDDAAIRQLKEKYFGRSEVTDVISFDMRESDRETLDCEIVVNAECAVREAQQRRGDPQGELNLYVVHGLLHQLGYNDRTLREGQIMHAKEDEMLKELGFGIVFGGTE